MKKINLILLFFPIFFFAKNDTLTLTTLNQRLSNLEEYKENIDKTAKIDYDNSIKEFKKDTEETSKSLFWLIGGLTVVAIAALGVNLYNLLWGINKKINKKITDKIETIVEQKREDIISIIKDEEYEKKLKNNKKILVISSSREAEEQIKNTFSKMGFKNIIFRVKDNFTNIPDNDIIIFNNMGTELGQSYIDTIVTQINDNEKCYIGYTVHNLERHEQFNFANSRFTLYHQILNTLKFSDLIDIIE
ncbi:NARF domain-containing protein [Chryseobacterium sp. MYb328]|uniref:NARF domain-containing protein n=1 Tax=Chryseobacterium sp. MYb328 TaxID=2745231 RepID=UPI0030A3733E